jgi:ubiquitin-activating enzyme E1
MTTHLDTNLYSRQIGTYGLETMGKLIKMKVLISGLRGIGVETAKNLILAGPGAVTIHDDTLVQLSDLGSNFYLTESDVGVQTRGQASLEKLTSLNSYVRVSLHQGPLTEDVLSGFNVVLLSESDDATITTTDQFCRSHDPPIGFISAESWGAAGYCFVDYGQDFIVQDKNGEESRSFIVANITQEGAGVVTVHEDKRHTFEDGDFVTFHEVQGMTQLNESEPRKVTSLSPFSFSIEDTTGYGAYSREGIVEQVKMPFKLSFKSWTESNLDPVVTDPLHVPDLGKFGRSEQLHIAFKAVRAFQNAHGGLPELNNLHHADEVVQFAVALNAQSKELGGLYVEPLEESVVKKVALYARAALSPFAAFWGGIVAQEIVKFTGKYTPLLQWLHFDSFEIIPEVADRTPLGSRYDDQVAVLGREVQNRLFSMRTFLVGAGALGCELLKGFALAGVACGDGSLVVTDDDQIEVSNLNRQFLFRPDDVAQSKSGRAAAAVKQMNPAFNVTARQTRVSPENETIFNDSFWESLDFVTNAVDNVNARLYVDERCVWYGKPLLESGTLGTKANTQVVLPHKTQSYGDSQDPPEESIPMCTLKNFPHAIEHCIEWARDVFEGLFSDGPREVNKYMDDPEKYIAQLPSVGNTTVQRTKLETVKKFLGLVGSATFADCVALARHQLEEDYHYNISQLLYNFPHDFTTKDGLPFWSGPKRAPEPAQFSVEDPDHIGYILAASNLFASIFGLQANHSLEEVKAIVAQVQVAPFEPKKVEISLEESKGAQVTRDDDEVVLSALMQELRVSYLASSTARVHPVQFEKDDDTNFHIDFVHAASSLRAYNYRISTTDRLKTKMIAGKIIPAIATTTAMITGAVLIEFYKLAQGLELEMFRNGFANLALPVWLFSEPVPPITIKSSDCDPVMCCPVRAYPEPFTGWDKLEIQGPFTLQEFIDHLADRHKLKVNILSSGRACLYNRYQANGNEGRLSKQLHELYQEISDTQIIEGRRYLAVLVSSNHVDEGIDTATPVIKYSF